MKPGHPIETHCGPVETPAVSLGSFQTGQPRLSEFWYGVNILEFFCNIIGNTFVNTLPPSNIWIRNRELTKLIHIGIKGTIQSNYYEIKSSRKINLNDDIRYKITIGRSITNKLNFDIFVVNNATNTGLGMGISYLLNQK